MEVVAEREHHMVAAGHTLAAEVVVGTVVVVADTCHKGCWDLVVAAVDTVEASGSAAVEAVALEQLDPT
jgi:hypothetical protein